jgi:hypothetical protein
MKVVHKDGGPIMEVNTIEHNKVNCAYISPSGDRDYGTWNISDLMLVVPLSVIGMTGMQNDSTSGIDYSDDLV